MCSSVSSLGAVSYTHLDVYKRQQLEHILVSGMFSAFFEIVIHNMTQEQARDYVQTLREFYTAGWQKVMGL